MPYTVDTIALDAATSDLELAPWLAPRIARPSAHQFLTRTAYLRVRSD